ncbi:MAG: hypothetical protein ACYDCL_18540 [Myxococcales bacterium]
MRRYALALCVFSTGGLGCGLSVHVTRLRGAPADARPIDATQVELFVDGKPSRDYVAAAHLDVQGSGASNVELVDALRTRAAELGCDGVIVESGPRPSALRGICVFWSQ